MKTLRGVLLLCLIAVAAAAVPVMAQEVPGAGSTCTNDTADGSGLPECGTPDDNECNPGGVLYREENQDGCLTEWYWKAGWFLARFRDGKISRADFPAEFVSVLPPENKAATPLTICHEDGDYSLCINSDGTGSETYQDAPWYYALFVNDKASCPATFNGAPFEDFDDYTESWDYAIYEYGFTVGELNSLGVAPYICWYYSETITR